MEVTKIESYRHENYMTRWRPTSLTSFNGRLYFKDHKTRATMYVSSDGRYYLDYYGYHQGRFKAVKNLRHAVEDLAIAIHKVQNDL